MRNVVTISLPSSLHKEVDQRMKEEHFASKSELFRYLIREWLAGDLLVELEESRREYRAGKAKKMKSVKELWK